MEHGDNDRTSDPSVNEAAATPAPSSNNDWRMVRMYELMEDFEDVLSRAPVSICTGQDPFLSMGGRTNENSSIAGGDVSENKCSRGSQRQEDPTPIFAAGNCLSSGCCYNSSSTESDTVRADQPRSTSKYKKQRERLLSRPTL